MKHLASAASIALLFSAATLAKTELDLVPYTPSAIDIDGQVTESAWAKGKWKALDKHILGTPPDEDDFSGRFKLLWDETHLYLLAEITDDVLFDQFADPLYRYWDDDCLEVFVDEDASGGEHQFNYNAFAYHIALDNQAVDIGGKMPDGSPEFLLLNEHVQSRWQRQQGKGNNIIWEVAIKLFSDDFEPGKNSQPVRLTESKQIGFMLAYCDNDGSPEREHFMGSHQIAPLNGDKNLGYKDAGVFGTIRLVK